MKRLGIALVCALAVALPSVAQLSGSWEARLRILPPPVELEKCVLTLVYGVAPGWKLTSTSAFTTPGLTGQAFGVIGEFGPLAITGGLDFVPQPPSTGPVTVTYPPGCSPQTESVTLTAPAYKSAWFKTTLSFFGASLTLSLNHWAFPYTQDPTDPKSVENYNWPCCPPQTTTYTLLGFTAYAAPVALTTRFADCCDGITFKDVTLTLSGASLCCGITHNIKVYFTKLGFQYLSFALDLPLCCGIFLEASVVYTVTQKSFSIKPKWIGGGACFEVYGDVITGQQAWEILGLAIYGYKLRCDFSTCSYVEFLTALNVTAVEEILEDEDLFQDDEFEYVKLGFCGPGCCGGMYTMNLAVYFQPSGSLFGFTRIGVELGAPLLANFTLTLSFGVSAIGGPTNLSVGWIFKF